ncbi:TetR family transcriptional regulator C-terminal domain-containing protein [Streptomyces sp. NRRL F-2890]|uniref:TetR family transcriptional regulator C-terminal domain-containing protein n=1 Tax=Streptomyces sp. NRRL F-2890 TaxID=1463845 RepID=UPI0004C9939A|nr:TetR family transcriptional regulator C-terminal domain-containing protein [Streptomyces sp. NRRL F-2890]
MSRPADGDADARLSRAVYDVLAHQGLERLTIRAVATAAGCTTGLVMHRFPHRRALLLHARRLMHERTRSRAEAAEAAAPTPRAALRDVLRHGLSLDAPGRRESVVWTGFLAAAVGDDELTALHRTHNRAWRQRVTRLVTAAAPDWPPERVSTVMYALISTAEGAAALAAGDPDTFTPAVQSELLDATLAAHGLH